MRVYHGSNSCFRILRVHQSLVKSSATNLNEGIGIYFSLDRNVASSYGKYMYTLEINDNYIRDFRTKTACNKYIYKLIEHIYNKEKVDITNYADIKLISEYMHKGNIAISGVGREAYMLLDSNEKFYSLGESKIEKVFKLLENYDKDNLVAYLFNYNIKDIGIIKKVNDDIVRIVNRQKMY